MLTDITIGQYFPGTSFLHRLDPRVKIVLLFALIVAIFAFDTPGAYAALTGLTLCLAAASTVPMTLLFKSVRPLWWLLAFTFLMHLGGTPGEVIARVWIFDLTWEGLVKGLFLCLRLVLLILLSSLLTFTTSPLMLTDALERLLRPLRCFGVPAHELAMMMTIALRFIPTLLNETDRVLKAQLARGADLDRGSIVKRMKAFIPVLVPLFVIVFQTADDLAVAMEARCYRGGEGRSRMKPFAWRFADTAALVFCFALVVGQKLLNWYVG